MHASRDTYIPTIGFTGTRNGLTAPQRSTLEQYIATAADYLKTSNRELRAIHGDCIGADADFDKVCREQGIHTECLPCYLDNMRAYCTEAIAPPMAPMARNRQIAELSDVVFGCPPNFDRIKKGSGTWATIGFTKRYHTTVIIVFPDGSTKTERGPLLRIVKDPEIQGGAPTFRGTRLTIASLLKRLYGGDSRESILQDYPHLSHEDIEAAKEWERLKGLT